MSSGPHASAWWAPALVVLGIVAAAGMLAACGKSDDESPAAAATSAAAEPAQEEATHLGTVTLSASDCTFDAAVENAIPAGPVSFTVVNESGDVAAFNMASLVEGTPYEEFEQYIDEERRLAEAGEEGLGLPRFVSDQIPSLTLEAGQSQKVEGSVDAGKTYGIVCLKVFAGDPGHPRPLTLLGPVEVGGE